MDIEVKPFSELSNHELYAILKLRAAVFVVEQDCAYQDLDDKDIEALHVMGKENGKLVAYSRIFKAGDYFAEASMGRIVVDSAHRSHGLGKEIVLASEQAIAEHFNDKPVKLSAQSYLQNFYIELGYQAVGEEYLEDGIPHIAMIKK